MLNVAELLADQGRLDEASVLFEEELQACREMFGNRHKRTLTSLLSLADLRQEQGRPKEALALLAEAQALTDYGKEHSGWSSQEGSTSASCEETELGSSLTEPESPRTPYLPDRRSPPWR